MTISFLGVYVDRVVAALAQELTSVLFQMPNDVATFHF